MNSQLSVLAIIPARFASTRFPGKPLVEISDKSMIQRTYEQVCKVGNWADVIIATDDERIKLAAEKFGARVMMTSKDHMTGTDRCAEVLATCNLQVDYVVNIQGDEPFIDPKQIQALISGFSNRPELVTLIKRIADLGTLFNPNSPKVIVDAQKQAIYFSRQTLPYLRSVPQDQWLNKGVFYKHIGLYAYRADVLPTLAKLQPSPLELAESLEQLRWIEMGIKFKPLKPILKPLELIHQKT